MTPTKQYHAWKETIFVIGNFKTNVWFLSMTVQLGVAKNMIN